MLKNLKEILSIFSDRKESDEELFYCSTKIEKYKCDLKIKFIRDQLNSNWYNKSTQLNKNEFYLKQIEIDFIKNLFDLDEYDSSSGVIINLEIFPLSIGYLKDINSKLETNINVNFNSLLESDFKILHSKNNNDIIVFILLFKIKNSEYYLGFIYE